MTTPTIPTWATMPDILATTLETQEAALVKAKSDYYLIDMRDDDTQEREALAHALRTMDALRFLEAAAQAT